MASPVQRRATGPKGQLDDDACCSAETTPKAPHMSTSTVNSLGELLAGISAGYCGCGPTTPITGMAVDSRKVSEGCVFVAIAGASHDGHRYVEAAQAAGAAVAVVTRGRCPVPDMPHVWLDDTARAAPHMAANAYRHPGKSLRLAGVTGTNGKTTTTHLLAAMLTAGGRRFARLGTTGDWIVDHTRSSTFTTPFPLELQALLREVVDLGGEDVVMEVSSHALAQGRVQPLRYQAVGLTSFSQDHLDFHGDMASYQQAKQRLVSEHLAATGVAVAVVDGCPAGEAFLAAAAKVGARAWSVSQRPESRAALRISRWLTTPGGPLHAEVTTPAGTAVLRSPLIGRFNVDNALVGLGLGLGLGLSLADAVAGLATSSGAPGRLESVQVSGVAGPAVYVDYAHTPDAVTRALEAVRPVCPGKLWVVLGCGGDRDRSKRPQMGAAAAAGADWFYATSDNPRTESPAAIVDDMVVGVDSAYRSRVIREVDRRRAIAAAIDAASPDDLILIAGKGHEDYQIVGTVKHHLDDREEAAKALAARGRST